jgi:hypothetical protein
LAERKRSALGWAAIAVEEHGRELAQSFVDAAKRGDWRAAEALMNRIYGKPDETVGQVEVNPATAVLRSMSLEEKLELLQSLAARRTDRAARRRSGFADRIDPTPPLRSEFEVRSPRLRVVGPLRRRPGGWFVAAFRDDRGRRGIGRSNVLAKVAPRPDWPHASGARRIPREATRPGRAENVFLTEDRVTGAGPRC